MYWPMSTYDTDDLRTLYSGFIWHLDISQVFESHSLRQFSLRVTTQSAEETGERRLVGEANGYFVDFSTAHAFGSNLMLEFDGESGGLEACGAVVLADGADAIHPDIYGPDASAARIVYIENIGDFGHNHIGLHLYVISVLADELANGETLLCFHPGKGPRSHLGREFEGIGMRFADLEEGSQLVTLLVGDPGLIGERGFYGLRSLRKFQALTMPGNRWMSELEQIDPELAKRIVRSQEARPMSTTRQPTASSSGYPLHTTMDR